MNVTISGLAAGRAPDEDAIPVNGMKLTDDELEKVTGGVAFFEFSDNSDVTFEARPVRPTEVSPITVTMKLIGNLKKQVDATKDVSEKRNLIEKAGMKLTDDELEMISGGIGGDNDVPDHIKDRMITVNGITRFK